MLEAEKSDLELILANSKTSIPKDQKEKVYKLLCDLRENATKPFGVIVVLGYIPPENSADDFNEYTDSMDEDLFKGSKLNIDDAEAEKRIAKAAGTNATGNDGAILIDPDGNILHSGVYLKYKDYKDILDDLGAPKEGSLSDRFGFLEFVGTRHVSAICFSYRMPETTVYIISEETEKMRIFEKGKIIFKEDKDPKKEILIQRQEQPIAYEAVPVS